MQNLFLVRSSKKFHISDEVKEFIKMYTKKKRNYIKWKNMLMISLKISTSITRIIRRFK
ncbi:hypothetical protein PFDG_05107 [Plasmodium falciparum Dd2]|uniref:Uncharacterized protein n=1 Tax=Plasmodium falciparum (isolate Dd2) TaxID=57267 RepID=A0A0L7M9M8_PLAF4|nr:hypothetical protein PFDG_05107 [Plasmodium falciparum Dd2]